MADVLNLELTDVAEDKLWRHGLSIGDVVSVLDAGEFRTYHDPVSPGRRYLIGPTENGRLLTFVIEPVDNDGNCLLITGWPSADAEATLFSRPGGSKHAGRPQTSD
jgi:hypothetical protein